MQFIFTNYLHLFPLEIQDFSVLSCSFVPVAVYSNLETEKLEILKNNKNQAGVYQLIHIKSGKYYIGSSNNISKRFSYYFNKKYLEQNKSMYICKALALYSYSGFSLTILKYVDISNKSKEEARKLILEREQFYIDFLGPEYNINPIAGSRLGSKASAETIAKNSKASKGRYNPMYGRIHSEETKHRMSLSLKGKIFSEETRKLLREARAKQIITEETKDKISKSLSKKVYVYSNSTPTILSYEFLSYTEAGKYFNCSYKTISRYLDNHKLFKKQWLLFSENKQLK
jgi:group I intron endonuclease